ncbi:uncharacterized protein PFB0145c-like [Centruroides sculpturatus]|uniref:uncharacterized protein PFB0145c-like n=1 Tax=Centruroides sculpturatus TaxID=218467 RepID=UPI000C6CF165|nr:uncharacterized protein PFB0145c-like [Centruroides sculpturatus]
MYNNLVTNVLCILDSIKSQNIIEHVQQSSDQSVQDVNDKNDFEPIKLTNETNNDLKNENNFDVNEIESNNLRNEQNELSEKQSIQKNTNESIEYNISKDIHDKFYRFISLNCDSNVSTDLLYELVENSNRTSKNKIKCENSLDMETELLEDNFNNLVEEKPKFHLLKDSSYDKNISSQSEPEYKYENVNGNIVKKEEIHENITKETAKYEEAIPYRTEYSFIINMREIGIQVCSLQMNEIGTQIEESDREYFYRKETNQSNKIDIGIQTDSIEESIPEKLQELELTVAEMKDVKKQHMNVACDMADKLNLISLRESELKAKLKETEEEKVRELELIKSEWNELENKYKEEILAWQKNAEKQSYVIHQLQIHFEQAQHLIYEKDVEITEMQRIISGKFSIKLLVL